MKKYLPFLLLGLGVLVLVVVFLVVRGKKDQQGEPQDETVAEIPFEKRPFAALLPSKDGHWLRLKIEKITGGWKSLDYELLYVLPDGRTQGVPGTVSLGAIDKFERDLLLGSESSGKFRYDEGVKTGTLTLRFRDEKGKLQGKLTTQFHLQNGDQELSSVDNKLSFKLSQLPKSGFFVTMSTFGLPGGSERVNEGPYGIFSSLDTTLSGKVSLGQGVVKVWSEGKWLEIKDGKANNVGVFIATTDSE